MSFLNPEKMTIFPGKKQVSFRNNRKSYYFSVSLKNYYFSGCDGEPQKGANLISTL